MLNEMDELKELKNNPHRDFYNCRKVSASSSELLRDRHPTYRRVSEFLRARSCLLTDEHTTSAGCTDFSEGR